MIPAVILSGVQPVEAGKPALRPRGESLRLLPQLDPGQILSARVESRLPDGSFRVLVAGREMRMALPPSTATGDRLQLTFVTDEPRMTFALKQVLPQAADTPLLSAAGRLVAAMMPQAGEPAMLARTAATAPLLAAIPADGAALSVALEQTLAQSGLFYEAHQADWLAGKHELARLRTEPQASFVQDALKAQRPLAQNTAAGTSTGASVTADASSAASTARGETLLHPQGLPMVQQQLAALESGTLLLQIEVWPRQWMQWEIEEREQAPGHDADAVLNWQTRLHLDLPRLGELNAILTLGGNGVQINLDAVEATSATLLHEHRDTLHAALTGAGFPPVGIAISRHEQR